MPCKVVFVIIAVVAISTFIQFVPGLISDVMLKVFMINPFLIRHTLVKRDTIAPLSPHKLIFMS